MNFVAACGGPKGVVNDTLKHKGTLQGDQGGFLNHAYSAVVYSHRLSVKGPPFAEVRTLKKLLSVVKEIVKNCPSTEFIIDGRFNGRAFN